MIKHFEMEVSAREGRGKNAARRLRATGKVPATLYGLGQDAVSLALDTKSMIRLLSSPTERNRVLDLKGGAAGPAMASDWQADPVTGKLLHVDLRRIDIAGRVVVKVPVLTTGIAYGVKTEGGMEDRILREVLIECKPEDIPESLSIDVTELKTDESVRVSDLDTGDMTVLSDANQVLVRIVGKRSEEEEEAAEAAAAEAAAEAAAGEGAADDEGGEEKAEKSEKGRD